MKNLGVKESGTTNLNEDKDCKEKYITKYGYPLMFHEGLEYVPEGFSFFLAHEFFDALPIHKFQV